MLYPALTRVCAGQVECLSGYPGPPSLAELQMTASDHSDALGPLAQRYTHAHTPNRAPLTLSRCAVPTHLPPLHRLFLFIHTTLLLYLASRHTTDTALTVLLIRTHSRHLPQSLAVSAVALTRLPTCPRRGGFAWCPHQPSARSYCSPAHIAHPFEPRRS